MFTQRRINKNKQKQKSIFQAQDDLLDKNKGNEKYGECNNCQFRRRAFSKHQLNFQEKGSEFINEQEVLLDLKQELVDYEEDLGK